MPGAVVATGGPCEQVSEYRIRAPPVGSDRTGGRLRSATATATSAAARKGRSGRLQRRSLHGQPDRRTPALPHRCPMGGRGSACSRFERTGHRQQGDAGAGAYERRPAECRRPGYQLAVRPASELGSSASLPRVVRRTGLRQAQPWRGAARIARGCAKASRQGAPRAPPGHGCRRPCRHGREGARAARRPVPRFPAGRSGRPSRRC